MLPTLNLSPLVGELPSCWNPPAGFEAVPPEAEPVPDELEGACGLTVPLCGWLLSCPVSAHGCRRSTFPRVKFPSLPLL
ncbi:hypothetical protein D3C86_670240 [compost metagenome]